MSVPLLFRSHYLDLGLLYLHVQLRALYCNTWTKSDRSEGLKLVRNKLFSRNVMKSNLNFVLLSFSCSLLKTLKTTLEKVHSTSPFWHWMENSRLCNLPFFFYLFSEGFLTAFFFPHNFKLTDSKNRQTPQSLHVSTSLFHLPRLRALCFEIIATKSLSQRQQSISQVRTSWLSNNGQFSSMPRLEL